MTTPTFHTVDVFAEEKYAGNQLAVFRNVEALSDAEMQKIAGYDVRIFTPSEEVPFAGHPTLGTAYVIGREIIKEPVGRVVPVAKGQWL